jgi:hypothetical protein
MQSGFGCMARLSAHSDLANAHLNEVGVLDGGHLYDGDPLRGPATLEDPSYPSGANSVQPPKTAQADGARNRRLAAGRVSWMGASGIMAGTPKSAHRPQNALFCPTLSRPVRRQGPKP